MGILTVLAQEAFPQDQVKLQIDLLYDSAIFCILIGWRTVSRYDTRIQTSFSDILIVLAQDSIPLLFVWEEISLRFCLHFCNFFYLIYLKFYIFPVFRSPYTFICLKCFRG